MTQRVRRRQVLPRLFARRGRTRDRGDGPVEFAIVALPLLLVTFLVAQAGLVFYARSVALGAATRGASAARAYNITNRGIGRTSAQDFVDIIGPGLSDVRVTQQTTATTVTVTVSGNVISLIPGLSFPVTQSASRPIERFTR